MSYQLQSSLAPEAVPALTAADIDRATQAIPAYKGGFAGRGITICAGGFTYFTNAWVLIRMLRKLGCQLPVQFWHYGEEELDRRMRRLVEPYGVECVDARRKAEALRCRISQGWPLKPFSILHSPFEEVLALDADNLPIRNPEYLFGYDAYRNTGAIFWPDVERTEPTRAIWDLMGVPFRNEPEFESGQIVVNKALCWEPLNLALWMNEPGRADAFYKIIWGDKDTFRFAWHKFGFPFAMPETPLQLLSVVGGPCCIGVMCQHDLDGERIFQHRNMLKWELFAENPWVPGFLFEGECREFLAELRGRWNGRIGESARRTTPATARRMRELQRKVWLLETIGEKTTGALPAAATQDAKPPAPATQPDGAAAPPKYPWPAPHQRNWQEIRFLEGGHCGRWSTPTMTFWELKAAGGVVRLRLAGREGAATPTAELKLQPDGCWQGRSLGKNGASKLRLVPVEKVYPSSNGNGTHGSRSKNGAPVQRAKFAARKIHAFNSAWGIGDQIHALYACVGAANAGFEITFHTRFPQWLERASHPGLTITGERPPVRRRGTGAIDLNHDASFQLRYGRDRARWYADAIAAGLQPARPARVDRTLRIPRFDFDRYVVLAPFSA